MLSFFKLKLQTLHPKSPILEPKLLSPTQTLTPKLENLKYKPKICTLYFSFKLQTPTQILENTCAILPTFLLVLLLPIPILLNTTTFWKKNLNQVISGRIGTGKSGTGNNGTNEKLGKHGTLSILPLKI